MQSSITLYPGITKCNRTASQREFRGLSLAYGLVEFIRIRDDIRLLDFLPSVLPWPRVYTLPFGYGAGGGQGYPGLRYSKSCGWTWMSGPESVCG